jgi:Copper type II ascorbate-dependent monooxygenase, C-terminal domain
MTGLLIQGVSVFGGFMTRSRAPLSALGVIALLSLSCGGESKNTTPTAETWSRLAEGDWTLDAGGEDPRWCKKISLKEDVYVAALRPIHPPGTHHTTLSLMTDDGKDTCTGSMFGPGMIYAAGAGTGELRMPPGVAMKLPAGQALALNLHIYNVTGAPMAGTSGIEIIRAKPEDVKHEADLLISGPTNISLPPGQKTTLSHTCAVANDQTMFTLFPHMHQLGVHIKTTVNVGGTPTVLHDSEYDFEEQYLLPFEPMAFHAGDSITTECTYQNTGPTEVTFGESSDTEMCFSILFRYPRGKSTFCTGPTEGGGQGGGGDGGSRPPCAMPGDPGNDVGVGKFCSAGSGQCGGNGAAALCLADFTQGAFANFCTLQCQASAECGTDAICGPSKICIPAKCTGDGGTGGSP